MSTKPFVISLPYIYPVCPLNLNHTRMFLLADVIKRTTLLNNKNQQVILPIGSHYSGNTTDKISNLLHNFFNNQKNTNNINTFNLYRHTYKTPLSTIIDFTNPDNIMNFYTVENFWELSTLNISCDFQSSYATVDKDFKIFVNVILDFYNHKKLLILNKKGQLALNYENKQWKNKALNTLANTKIYHSFQTSHIKQAILHLDNNWSILRDNGIGTPYQYNSKTWILDPMFDSELFTIFDLYKHFTQTFTPPKNKKVFFTKLIHALSDDIPTTNPLIENIKKSLPCDIFIGEEHLKNWIGKKILTETVLLHPKYRTKKYIIIGMGLLNKKRMSASRGNAILSKNLIDKYGPHITRIIMLLLNNNVSKTYNYDYRNENLAKKFLDFFTNHLISIRAKSNTIKSLKNDDKSFDKYVKELQIQLNQYLEKLELKQFTTQLLWKIPQKHTHANPTESLILWEKVYSIYTPIILPGYITNFIKLKL